MTPGLHSVLSPISPISQRYLQGLHNETDLRFHKTNRP
uniref:Uncharacterized protein n=1 Tax=Anguilla anguilla TaxID=7936 RepID=A0A0E9RLV0_ANGAN